MFLRRADLEATCRNEADGLAPRIATTMVAVPTLHVQQSRLENSTGNQAFQRASYFGGL